MPTVGRWGFQFYSLHNGRFSPAIAGRHVELLGLYLAYVAKALWMYPSVRSQMVGAKLRNQETKGNQGFFGGRLQAPPGGSCQEEADTETSAHELEFRQRSKGAPRDKHVSCKCLVKVFAKDVKISRAKLDKVGRPYFSSRFRVTLSGATHPVLFFQAQDTREFYIGCPAYGAHFQGYQGSTLMA